MKNFLHRSPMILPTFRDRNNYFAVYLLGFPSLLVLLLANGHFAPPGRFVFVWGPASWYFLAGYLCLPVAFVLVALIQQRQLWWQRRVDREQALAKHYLAGIMVSVGVLWLGDEGIRFLVIMLLGIVAFPLVLPFLGVYWGLLRKLK